MRNDAPHREPDFVHRQHAAFVFEREHARTPYWCLEVRAMMERRIVVADTRVVTARREVQRVVEPEGDLQPLDVGDDLGGGAVALEHDFGEDADALAKIRRRKQRELSEGEA